MMLLEKGCLRWKHIGITKNYVYPDLVNFTKEVTNNGIIYSLTK